MLATPSKDLLGVTASSMSVRMRIAVLYVLIAFLIWIAILAVTFIVTFITFHRSLSHISIFSYSVI